MAAHSNRPINPKPRNSENNSSTRTSFSGSAKPSFLTNPRRLDPTTPASTPSDFATRRSVGKEGNDLKEKENDEKDSVLNASKLQSPAKGCKNFMSPTISAASKFTPSPRKKVLVERNDHIRTESTCLDSNLADSEYKKAVPRLKKVVFSDIPFDSEHSTESDGLNTESILVGIAPLDADPYDPKNNYLSPRPHFICYKPDDSFDESQKGETDIAASADMVIGVDEVIQVDSHTTAYEERFVQNNGKRRLMCFSVIITLLIGACVLIMPSFDEVFVKDLRFSDINNLYQKSKFAFNRVSASSVAIMFKLANELGKGEKRTPIQFVNLSDLLDGTWNEGYFPSVMASLEQLRKLHEDEEEMDHAFVEDEYADEDVVDIDQETLGEEASYTEFDANEEIYLDSVNLAELELQDSQGERELVSSLNTNSADQPHGDYQHQETGIALERQETEESEADINLDTIPLDQTSFDMITPSLFAGVVVVALALIYQYKRNHHPKVEQVLRKQTPQQEEETSQNWRTESEMSSSFQTSYSMVREANEVESSERKARKFSRRESSLGSSSGSLSYGSFTTYERLPIKSNANADEEIISPVRRSSRLRNHYTLV